MFCGKCGEQIDEGIVFCPKCGHKLVDSLPKKKIPTKVIAGIGSILVAALIVVIVIVLTSKKGGISTKGHNYSSSGGYTASNSSSTGSGSQTEYTEFAVSEQPKETDLSNEEKDKLKKLSDIYKSASVRNGKFSYANDMCHAYQIYSGLSSNAKDKWEYKDEFITKFGELSDNTIVITNDNFLEVFDVVYAVGKKTDSGWGEKTIYTGREKISFEWDGVYREPETKDQFNHDYATPVDVGIKCKYPYLNVTCSVDINLHQTYQGIIMKGTYEFKYQSGHITFDSKNGDSAAVTIYVEDNQVSKSNTYSYDLKDMFHDIDSFSEGKVKFTVNSGTARCY